jgi:hypothetical protein
MTKAKLFLGLWIVLLSAIAGGFYYFIAIKENSNPLKPEKVTQTDKLTIGEIGGWFKGFSDTNRTLYPATEFVMEATVGDKREEPFYAISLNGLTALEIGGVERKLASMGLLYVSDYDGVKYSFLVLFEDKNAMLLSFNELKKVYPFATQGTMPLRSSN